MGRRGDGPRFAGGPKTSRPPGAGAKRRPPLASADIGRKLSLNVQYGLRLYAHIRSRCANWGKVRPSFAIRGKTCGPKGRRPTFCWGALNAARSANLSNSHFGESFRVSHYPIDVKLGKIDAISMSLFGPCPPKNRKKMATLGLF